MIRGDLTCPDCGGRLEYVEASGARAYPHYLCEHFPMTGCGGMVTAHRKTGEPMGVPANRETRQARMLAHRAFDWMWQSGETRDRREAYRWLAEHMGLPKAACHIGMMSKAQCERVVEVIEQYQLERYGAREKVPGVPMGLRGSHTPA